MGFADDVEYADSTILRLEGFCHAVFDSFFDDAARDDIE